MNLSICWFKQKRKKEKEKTIKKQKGNTEKELYEKVCFDVIVNDSHYPYKRIMGGANDMKKKKCIVKKKNECR
jgi:hypothetical protein